MLNGYTIRMTAPFSTGVLCGGKVRIIGPGTITNTTGTGLGVETSGRRSIRLEGVTITGSEEGVGSVEGRITLIDTTMDGTTGPGAVGRRVVKLKNSTVTGSGTNGIEMGSEDCRKGRIKLKNSAVTGSGQDTAVCGVSQACADLASCKRPSVKRESVCDTSHDLASGFPGTSWGVCALD